MDLNEWYMPLCMCSQYFIDYITLLVDNEFILSIVSEHIDQRTTKHKVILQAKCHIMLCLLCNSEVYHRLMPKYIWGIQTYCNSIDK